PDSELGRLERDDHVLAGLEIELVQPDEHPIARHVDGLRRDEAEIPLSHDLTSESMGATNLAAIVPTHEKRHGEIVSGRAGRGPSTSPEIRAAAEAGRVVVVARVVRGRRVAASFAMTEARDVLVVAAVERAAPIGDPLVEVADHVEHAVAVRAAGVLARLRERAFDLVQLRLVHRPLRVVPTEERDDRILAAIVAATRLAMIAVAVRVLLRPATRLPPFGAATEALARRAARARRLLRAHVAL